MLTPEPYPWFVLVNPGKPWLDSTTKDQKQTITNNVMGACTQQMDIQKETPLLPCFTAPHHNHWSKRARGSGWGVGGPNRSYKRGWVTVQVCSATSLGSPAVVGS